MKSFIVLFLIYSVAASEKSESFLIGINDYSVKVTSPVKRSPVVGFVVDNHTLSTIYGKIVSGDKDLKFFTIESQKTKTFDLKINSNEKISFIPLSPPAQEIDLVFNRKVYEIPPQK